jgi:hypothetical protein
MIRIVPSQPGSEVIQNPRLLALARYWNAKRGEKQLPARADIDPVEVPSLLPIVLLAEIEDGAPRVRLLGSEATAAYGAEIRGLQALDLNWGEFTASWREACVTAQQSSGPVMACGHFTRPGQYSRVESLLMPLSNGKAVTHLFGGLVITPASQNFFAYSPQPASCIRILGQFAANTADEMLHAGGKGICGAGT